MSSQPRWHKRTYVLLACMVLFSSFGNILLGKGMKQVGEIANFSPAALLPVLFKIFVNANIWLGIASLLLFFISYMMLLSWADLSYVQPASAIGYAAVPFFGYLFLGELISRTQWIGVLFICAGVALVGATAPGSTGDRRS